MPSFCAIEDLRTTLDLRIMFKVSTMLTLLLVAGLLVGMASTSSAAHWPVKGDVDLSSGFGDFREGGRFHKGLDIRTGGRIGRPVESPVDGYLWRVRMTYYGAGKAVYVKGDDGRIYVFYHLSKLGPKIDKPVIAEQLRQQRFIIDKYFPRDSIRIKQGEFVAYSGKTGTGAPHLHFEVRTSDNEPINPLLHGFELNDKTAPVFDRLGIELTDDRSLLPTGGRKFFINCVSKGSNRFGLDTVLYLNSPFGLLSDCYDRMRPGGMKRAIHRLSLYVDDSLFYRVTLDTLDFDFDAYSLLEFDYLEVNEKRKRVRRLFKSPGNVFPGSVALANGDGVYGKGEFAGSGRHHALVVGEDPFGNRTELSFDFLWGPRDTSVFLLDSLVEAAGDTAHFYFSPIVDVSEFEIDSVRVLQNIGNTWKPRPRSRARTVNLDHGRIRYTHIGHWRTALLRLGIYHSGSSLIEGNIFTGIKDVPGKIPELAYHITNHGILVILEAAAKYAPKARVELYYRDSLLGIEYPRVFTMQRHIGLIPPDPKYRRIDRFGYALTQDTTVNVPYFDTVDVWLAGLEDLKIPVDDYMTLYVDKEDVFAPQYLEVRSNLVLKAPKLRLNSNHYEIFPEVFACRKPFDMELRYGIKRDYNSRSGLCWLDEEEDEWVWLDDNEFRNDTAWAKSIGGGSFASVFDFNPPRIERLRPGDGRSVTSVRPRISFGIVDTLSGVYDDRNITIKIDNEWMIPQYDPETGGCFTIPHKDLEFGRHHLSLIITDRAGNTTEQYSNFRVRKDN